MLLKTRPDLQERFFALLSRNIVERSDFFFAEKQSSDPQNLEPTLLKTFDMQGRHRCRVRMIDFQVPLGNGSRQIMPART